MIRRSGRVSQHRKTVWTSEKSSFDPLNQGSIFRRRSSQVAARGSQPAGSRAARRNKQLPRAGTRDLLPESRDLRPRSSSGTSSLVGNLCSRSEQHLHGRHRIGAGQSPSQGMDLRQVGRRNGASPLCACRSAAMFMAGKIRRSKRSAVQHDLGVPGSLELLEDDLVHARAGVDQSTMATIVSEPQSSALGRRRRNGAGFSIVLASMPPERILPLPRSLVVLGARPCSVIESQENHDVLLELDQAPGAFEHDFCDQGCGCPQIHLRARGDDFAVLDERRKSVTSSGRSSTRRTITVTSG